jgi:anti-sigma regulatory factor (Ser/Thr protein kinase)
MRLSGRADPRWPLVSELELDATGEAPAGARRHLTKVLAAWAVPRELAAEAELICSELVTNAVQATRKLAEERPVALRLLANAERLVVEVWDCHPGAPVRRFAADDAERGRGLAIVAGLSDRWGSRRLGPRAKAVWAELPLPPHPAMTPRRQGSRAASGALPVADLRGVLPRGLDVAAPRARGPAPAIGVPGRRGRREGAGQARQRGCRGRPGAFGRKMACLGLV